jgi:chromosome condensin MukBEF ATPase and DNA-binding subunit MukB
MEDLYLVEDPSRFRRESLRREACERSLLVQVPRRRARSSWWPARRPAR